MFQKEGKWVKRRLTDGLLDDIQGNGRRQRVVLLADDGHGALLLGCLVLVLLLNIFSFDVYIAFLLQRCHKTCGRG